MQQLFFNGFAVGDYIKKFEPANVTLTPATRRTGLFQDVAAVNSDSRNMLNALRFILVVKRADNVAAVEAIALIQNMQGLTGDIEVKDNGIVRVQCTAWTIDHVDSPRLLEAFGGRFTDQLSITVIGETGPLYL